MMRSPNGSSRFRPTIAWQVDAALAAAGGQLADDLALKRLLVERALAGDHERRLAHERVEADRVEHVGRARHERRAERGPQPAREPAGAAGHGLAARDRAGTSRPARRAAARAASTIAAIGALLWREDARSVLERNADVTHHSISSRVRRRPRRAPRARPRRRRWWRSRRPSRSPCSAPASTAAAISSPVPRVDAAQASRSSSSTSDRPLACAISTTAGAVRAAARTRPRRPAERVGDGDRPDLAAERRRRAPPSCPRRRRPRAARAPRGRRRAGPPRSRRPPRAPRRCP